MNRRVKVELAFAIIMAVVISTLAIFANQPSHEVNYAGPGLLSNENPMARNAYGLSEVSGIQQRVTENIEGEMRKGSFESTVESLRALTFHYSGTIPYLSLAYANEFWSGTLNCEIPTENVTSFTFGVRQLISANGTVTHITISITQTKVNQTGSAEEQLSEVSIGLREVSRGGSPIVDQLGAAFPWLATGLVWVAEGLILGVPLCFVSLGIVVMVDRGIVPAWKKQLKGKAKNKTDP